MSDQRVLAPLLLAGVMAIAAMAACGSSSSPPSSAASSSTPTPTAMATPAATPTPTPSAAPLDTASCPSASIINAALGSSLQFDKTISSKKLVDTLPSGTGHVACEYVSANQRALVVLLNNIPASLFITEEVDVADVFGLTLSQMQPVPVSGFGDEAQSYTYTGPEGAGMILDVQQGTNRVAVFVGGGSPSLTELEGLVTQLMG
ncbi:MAG TPA: hypothetical protein VEK76_04510 [Candidatus Binatia bacterium]|nr:hypothetical protein [Candidatus Binatia bacterium]